MINIITAYDDNDGDLGDYFNDTFNSIHANISANELLSNIAIRGLECNEIKINETIALKNNNPFIFIALSHGNDQQLLTENDVFVSDSNGIHFANSLVYTTACCTCYELGPLLVNTHNCLCYVGYNHDSYATYEDFYSIYIECESHCILEFLNSSKTINTTFDEMLALFDLRINSLTDIGEILVAIELQNNKDCLELIGNRELTSNHFNL